MVRWRRARVVQGAVCKTAYTGSIPVVASTFSGSPPIGLRNPLDVGTVTVTSADAAIYQSSFAERRELSRGGGLPAVEGCL